MRLIFCIALFCGLGGCGKLPTSEQLLLRVKNNISKADTIKTIIALADCRTQQGAYTTEIHSDENGYTYFKQIYSYRPSNFEAIALNDSIGFLVVNSLKADSLVMPSIYALKSHEFHKLLLDAAFRYHSFSKPVTMEEAGTACWRIDAKDVLNNPIEIYIDDLTSRIKRFVLCNPEDVLEKIEISYSNWTEQGGLLLPRVVLIRQGEAEFVFTFVSVEINSKKFKRWTEIVN